MCGSDVVYYRERERCMNVECRHATDQPFGWKKRR
jgi:hypothetical protein